MSTAHHVPRVLVAVAVDAEADAVRAAGCTADVVVVGVGPAESAARTAQALARTRYDLVLSAGIGGGFAPLVPGDVAVAARIVFADLGAETAEGFAPVSALGFGGEHYDVEPALAVALADRTGGHLGTVLTVATVTGSEATAQALLERHPDAVAEAMEGAGVAAAARSADPPVAVAELRAVSNPVGPRDRDAWQIPRALDALGRAVAAATAPSTEETPPA